MSEEEVRAGDVWEDVPMRRYPGPVPVKGGAAVHRPSPCQCREELGQILSALECRNQLLVDLLGAVNGLTATLLAGRGET